MISTIKWLWACYLARRFCHSRRTLFSDRTKFLYLLRPQTEAGARIAYPDAWLWIKPRDVRRARDLANSIEIDDAINQWHDEQVP